MSEEKIRTLHPEGKKGVHISRAKYEAVREALLASLRERGGEMTHEDLLRAVEQKLAGNFEGNIGWYTEGLKLDLEARGLIERVKNSRPQIVRLHEK